MSAEGEAGVAKILGCVSFIGIIFLSVSVDWFNNLHNATAPTAKEILVGPSQKQIHIIGFLL